MAFPDCALGNRNNLDSHLCTEIVCHFDWGEVEVTKKINTNSSSTINWKKSGAAQLIRGLNHSKFRGPSLDPLPNSVFAVLLSPHPHHFITNVYLSPSPLSMCCCCKDNKHCRPHFVILSFLQKMCSPNNKNSSLDHRIFNSHINWWSLFFFF